jgi:hypothetical protein
MAEVDVENALAVDGEEDKAFAFLISNRFSTPSWLGNVPKKQ